MKRFQVHEEESGWGGYLVDKVSEAAIPFLGRRAKLSVAHSDADIVQEAWYNSRTIVTSNGRDFVRHIREFQKRENNRGCRDLWGLLLVPNAQLLRGKALTLIRHGLDIPRFGQLSWRSAAFLNLYVHLNAVQRPTVRRFERCSFCERRPIRDPWNKWYHSLPVIGGE